VKLLRTDYHECIQEHLAMNKCGYFAIEHLKRIDVYFPEGWTTAPEDAD